MKTRALALLAGGLLLVACPEPTKGPEAPKPTPETPPPPTTTTPPVAPPPVAKPKPLAPGTRLVLAERKNDEVWDKMAVGGGRLWALTNLSRWTNGPMYVPAARLWSVPLTGGELARSLDLEGMASLATDDTSLYVAVNRDLSKGSAPKTGRVFRLPLSGGAPQPLAGGLEPRVIAVDGETLWVDDMRMPKDGSKPLSPSGVKDALAIALDDDNVYFATAKGAGGNLGGDTNAKAGGRVFRVAKKGGAPALLASKLPDEPGALAVDGTHVYFCAMTWTSATERAGIVARVPKAGGDTEILAKDLYAVRKLWVSGDHVYFLSGRGGRPGAVLRTLKTGGAPETIASDETLEYATVDDTSVYFSSDGKFRAEPFERLTPASLVRIVK